MSVIGDKYRHFKNKIYHAKYPEVVHRYRFELVQQTEC